MLFHCNCRIIFRIHCDTWDIKKDTNSHQAINYPLSTSQTFAEIFHVNVPSDLLRPQDKLRSGWCGSLNTQGEQKNVCGEPSACRRVEPSFDGYIVRLSNNSGWSFDWLRMIQDNSWWVPWQVCSERVEGLRADLVNLLRGNDQPLWHTSAWFPVQ